MGTQATAKPRPITRPIDMEKWTEAEASRLRAAIHKLEGEPVPDLEQIAGHKRVLAAVEKLRVALSGDRRSMPDAS
jgi:hypothetical protein